MRVIRAPAGTQSWATTDAGVKGAAGEARTVAALGQVLDDRYLAIQGLRFAGTDADLDLVVVAERIVVLEVKAYAAERRYRCEGSLWLYGDARGSWWPLDGAPGAQAAWGARRVRGRLLDAGIATPAVGAVVWAGEAPLELERPRVPVLRLQALGGWLGEFAPVPAAQVERVRRVLLHA